MVVLAILIFAILVGVAFWRRKGTGQHHASDPSARAAVIKNMAYESVTYAHDTNSRTKTLWEPIGFAARDKIYGSTSDGDGAVDKQVPVYHDFQPQAASDVTGMFSHVLYAQPDAGAMTCSTEIDHYHEPGAVAGTVTYSAAPGTNYYDEPGAVAGNKTDGGTSRPRSARPCYPIEFRPNQIVCPVTRQLLHAIETLLSRFDGMIAPVLTGVTLAPAGLCLLALHSRASCKYASPRKQHN